MSAYTGLSALGSGSRSFEEGSHLRFTLKKEEEQCHKLLLVLGGAVCRLWWAVVQCAVCLKF